jgi:hypothetical protein
MTETIRDILMDDERRTTWKKQQNLLKIDNMPKIQAFIKAGLRNPWLNRSIDIDDGEFVCEDFLETSSFIVVETWSFLKANLEASNWSINQAFVFGDFAFINQVVGGHEWAVFKYDKDKNVAFQFESWTGCCCTQEEFKKIQRATNEQLIKLEWMRRLSG